MQPILKQFSSNKIFEAAHFDVKKTPPNEQKKSFSKRANIIDVSFPPNASNANQFCLNQLIWGTTCWHTVERSQTNESTTVWLPEVDQQSFLATNLPPTSIINPDQTATKNLGQSPLDSTWQCTYGLIYRDWYILPKKVLNGFRYTTL